MKRTSKKLMCIMLSVVMMLAMSVMAFADGTGQIVINAADGVTFGEGTTFTAYKVMDLTYLENVTDDNNYVYTTATDFEAYFASLDPSLTTSDEVYTYLQSHSTDIATVGTDVYTWISANAVVGTTGTVSTDGTSYTISGLDNGYYFVYQTGTDEGGATSAVIIQTLAVEVNEGTVTVNQKTSVPTLNKEVEEDGAWGTVTDKGIGDTVDFRITTTVPDVSTFTSYEYIIHDTMSTGLTFDDTSVVITATGDGLDDNVLIAGSDYTMTTGTSDDCTFEISFTKETLATLYEAGYTTLFTTYDAVLNENATTSTLTGLSQNVNTAYLEYTNVSDGSGTGKTEEDKTYVYTFQLDAVKVNANGSTLEGAGFQLYVGDVVVELLYNANTNTYMVKGDGVAADGVWTDCGNTIETHTNGEIKIVGLDDDVEYTLKETIVPEGYVAAADIVFTIQATYDDTSALSSLTTSNQAVGGNTDGSVDAGNIVNIAKSILPSTGGIGTTIFYVVGIVLMVGAVTLLLLKKKNTVEE